MHTKFLQRHILSAAAALLFAAPAAHAAVVSVSYASAPVLISNNIDGTYFNFVTGAYVNAGSLTGYDFNPYNNGAGLTFYGAASPSGIMASGTPGTMATALALTFGALISSAGQFNQFQTVGSSFYRTGQEYVGLRFLNEATGAINYGWALMSTNAGTTGSLGFAASLLAYGYENTGASITAGQTAVAVVPEPASIALLGLAFAGMAVVRRRKAA